MKPPSSTTRAKIAARRRFIVHEYRTRRSPDKPWRRSHGGPIVAAETTAGLPGLGGLAWVSKKTGRSDIVILCIVTIGITAVLFDHGIKALERRLLPWRGHG